MKTLHELYEQFAPLNAVSGLAHFFTLRIPGVPVSGDKAQAVAALEDIHAQIARIHGIDFASIVRCEQTHGDMSVIVESLQARPIPEADALVTRAKGLPIGIHVADCCPVFIHDSRTPSIGLVHSGKRGTLLDITGKTVDKMFSEFGCAPDDLTVVLGPCIRKENYEMDIPAEITKQLRARGVSSIHDCRQDTAADIRRYYSYRVEKGKTGRLFAVMMLR
ncbi:polyphenol oxidase family protein [Oscillatoria amoena NRMC-F 0135]|nr:polyphenol oxidase family protein [Oscillatoria laete-virens]MDL5047228.1 polyphenol oxidase family protein [Oscillatoria amoena NRMC-F 0135]MDL5052542.1 polyphenol oxidase family protein [Oscillatoria laete-virens NRMC-F 0139]